jgi:DNA-binding transcriptional regulator YdaS (Cro superfamily)
MVPMRAIATHLGRSPRAIEQYLCKERRVSALRHASARGMTTPDVARALGVHRPSVARWIASGRLMATETWLHSRQIYLVAPADLRRFILSGALVGRTFNASAEWRGVINRAEINWRLRFVSAAQLEALLHITAAHFSASGHMRGVDRDTACLLFWSIVDLVVCFLLALGREVKRKGSSERGLAVVDVTDGAHVQVWLAAIKGISHSNSLHS